MTIHSYSYSFHLYPQFFLVHQIRNEQFHERLIQSVAWVELPGHTGLKRKRSKYLFRERKHSKAAAKGTV